MEIFKTVASASSKNPAYSVLPSLSCWRNKVTKNPGVGGDELSAMSH